MKIKLSIKEAKAALPLPQLAERLGIPSEIPEYDGQSVQCFWPERHNNGDRNPSFNFYANLTRYKCFGCQASGDGPDLVAEWLGHSKAEACRTFVALARQHLNPSLNGGISLSRPHLPSASAVDSKPEDDWGDSTDKQQKRKGWSISLSSNQSQLAELAKLRGIDVRILEAASQAGALKFGNWGGKEAWLLQSDCGRLAQARPLDGSCWRVNGKSRKAWSLPGALASVPLGFSTIRLNESVALVEGGPDWLAIRQLLSEQEHLHCCALGLLGAGLSLSRPVLDQLAGRTVRIFAHADSPGRKAAAMWYSQLRDVHCRVDAFDFGVFGVKDVNDFIKLPLATRNVEVMP